MLGGFKRDPYCAVASCSHSNSSTTFCSCMGYFMKMAVEGREGIFFYWTKCNIQTSVLKMLRAIRTISHNKQWAVFLLAPFKNLTNGNIRGRKKLKLPPLSFFMGQLQPSRSCGFLQSLTQEKIGRFVDYKPRGHPVCPWPACCLSVPIEPQNPELPPQLRGGIPDKTWSCFHSLPFCLAQLWALRKVLT